MLDIARKIYFTGNEEHAWSLIGRATALFFSFVSLVRASSRDNGSTRLDLPGGAYIEVWFFANAGHIHIHGVLQPKKKDVSIDLVKRDITCVWNKKLTWTRELNAQGQIVETKKTWLLLFHGHGFGTIYCGANEWEVYKVSEDYVYGEKLYIDSLADSIVNTSFFSDDIYKDTRPDIPSSLSSGSIRTLNDFYVLTERVVVHTALLRIYPVEGIPSDVYRTYLVPSIDGMVPVQTSTDGYSYTPALCTARSSIFPKSKSSMFAHQHNIEDEMAFLSASTFSILNSQSFNSPGGAVVNTKYYGVTMFSGDPNVPGPSWHWDSLGEKIACCLRGTTEVGDLVFESHIDIPPLWDQYSFSSINTGAIYIYRLGGDGSVSEYSHAVVTNRIVSSGGFYSYGQTFYDRSYPIPEQPGYPIREGGMTLLNSIGEIKIVSLSNKAVFLVNSFYELHDGVDYNAFVDFGGGFVAMYVPKESAIDLKSIVHVAEDGLTFVHNQDGNFCLARLTYLAGSLEIATIFSAFSIEYDAPKKKEIRVYYSKNYKWMVLYNIQDASANNISGVYSLSGTSFSRIGDATGIEPVEIDKDERYLLMRDKAYGSISREFSHLVGMFYDKQHYLEMETNAETGQKRFVIKNAADEEIRSTNWGDYSFYELESDGGVATISHCAINGVKQSVGSGALLVNFTDGPFEFESVCHSLVYNFTIDVPNGYIQQSGAPDFPPELASPFYGPPDREPPYGRKNISMCKCDETVWVNGVPLTRARRHVMISPAVGEGFIIGDIYCQHRPGWLHQRVDNVAIRTVYKRPKQQRELEPLMENQLVKIVALAHGYFYERITDEIGKVDPALLDSGDYVYGEINLKQS